jgi:hypothetical protein
MGKGSGGIRIYRNRLGDNFVRTGQNRRGGRTEADTPDRFDRTGRNLQLAATEQGGLTAPSRCKPPPFAAKLSR